MSEAHNKVDIGALDDFPQNELRLVTVGKREIGVYRTSAGPIYAVLNYCPHKGAPLCEGAVGGTLVPSEPGEMVYGMEGEVVRCPWHGYEFSLKTGECLFIGLKMRARTFAVEIRDGRVLVDGLNKGAQA
jgi:nitrite reductase (NADH) small subunit